MSESTDPTPEPPVLWWRRRTLWASVLAGALAVAVVAVAAVALTTGRSHELVAGPERSGPTASTRSTGATTIAAGTASPGATGSAGPASADPGSVGSGLGGAGIGGGTPVSGTPVTDAPRDRYPARPTNLTATAVGNIVRLQWRDNSHNESGFHVGFVGSSGLTSVFLAGGTDATFFQFPEVPDGWAACFAVRAFTTSGSFYFASAWYPAETSSNICVSIPRRPPPAPTGLTAQAYAEYVQVQWIDQTQGVPEFALEVTRGLNQTFTAYTTNHQLNVPPSIESGVEYCFRVRAIVRPENSGGSDNLGESPWSDQVCATTRPYPAAPTNLTVVPVSPDTLRLTWTDNSAIETFFRIARISQPPTRDVPANTTSYEWTGLTPGVEYCFQVSAYADDRRASSERACATPG